MSDTSASTFDPKKIQSYLDDVSNAKAREDLLESARSGGMDKPDLASVTKKGMFHTGEGLSPAAGMVRSSDGHLFVSDEFNHRIMVYGPNLELETTFGSEGAGEGELRYPRGLALDGEGNLYVADAWNHRITIFDSGNRFAGIIGRLGTGQGEMDEPVDLAWHNGRLIVLEKSNHRIHFFDSSGNSQGFIGMRGSVDEQIQFFLTPVLPEIFSTPVFEFPSSLAVDSGGCIYVADTNNHRVVKISSENEADSGFVTTGLRYPAAVAFDGEDNLHVTQFNRVEVSVFSTDGILLYRYRPADMELPAAIYIAGTNLFIAGGLKPSIASFALQPRHMPDIAAEEEFSGHIKFVVASMRKGRWDDALERLVMLADVSAKPSAMEFARLLPELDYTMAKVSEGINRTERADRFLSMLNGYADELWESVSATMEAGVSALDKLSENGLELEKSTERGEVENDDLLVKNYRATKELYNLSTELKKKLEALKKIQQFHRRMAFAGFGVESRLDRLAENIKKISEWKEKRDEWFAVAEREAPSITYSSFPDERASFAKNQRRLSFFGYVFIAFWDFAADQNRELAALVQKNIPLDNSKFENLTLNAVDFITSCPESSSSRFQYFNSLVVLLDSIGEEKLSDIASRLKGFWQPLGLEDNIPPKTNGEVYRLLTALWAGGSLECEGEVNAESWEKITDFYHGEFRRYISENSQLQEELIRNSQLLPKAEKTDPKQAALINRKLSLLDFHYYFQERYIGNMMIEYLVRFALFTLKNRPIDSQQAARTKEEVDKLFLETVRNHFVSRGERGELKGKMPGVSDTNERNKLVLRTAVLESMMEFSELLLAHLRVAKKSVSDALNKDEKPAKVLMLSGAESVFRPIVWPSGLAFGDDGNLFVLSPSHCNISVFDRQGRLVRVFAGYGNAEGRLKNPIDIIRTDDGLLLVSQYLDSSMSFFSQDGKFVRRIVLDMEEGRQPIRIQTDSTGRLYVSFADSRGISVFDPDGKQAGNIEKIGSALEYIERLTGFCINKDRIIAGGNGKFVITDLEGKELQSITCTDLTVEYISSIAADEQGNIYAVDLKNNLLLHINPSCTEVRQVEEIYGHGLVEVAVQDNRLAVADSFAGVVWVLDSVK